jgi:diaminopimelate epimerase
VIPFVKASGCGNDFLIIEESAYSGDRHALSIKLCDRTRGIGADGVEWISPGDPGESDVTATLINADGSEAEISGNGTRCVAAYIASQDPRLRSVRVKTGAGVKICDLSSINGASYGFATAMGPTWVDPLRPLKLEEEVLVEGRPVDLGNPHFVITGESLFGDWREMAQKIQAMTSEFPHGVNVEFAIVRDRRSVEAWFYERGAGETRSSGTGSCAVAAACRAAGFVDDVVDVIAPGGAQTVEFRGDDLILRGNAELICRGEAWI